MDTKHVLVLGAGVSGLSSGILLLKEGYNVTIWAKDLPPNTTSNKAAAVWYPFICQPPDKATRWAKIANDYFRDNILDDPKSGTKRMKVIEIFTGPKEDPWWRDGVDTYRRTTPEELPPGYTDGYAIEGFVMDTDMYMDYLVSMFKNLGGTIIQKEIADIKETFTDHPLVINCTGLGSRTLFSDNEIYPCRGQIVKIKDNGFSFSMFEEEGPNSLAYIIPRLHDIVLGGTAQNNDWNLEADPKDTEDILRKCSAIYPEFKNVEILEIKVGLRPSRSSIRVEAQRFGENTVIHNYGHGGGGFTLSWGCAKDVLDLVRNAKI